MWHSLLIILFLKVYSSVSSNLVITTSGGQVRGQVEESRIDANTRYYSFKGIPYASPPIGDLRFRQPEPIKWEGIKEAKEFGHICPQVCNDGLVRGNEDCLTLNVYTKELSPKDDALRPVMFWIHGGAFATWTGALYGPDFLVEHDVVVVTINYRLGILGFLSLNDENTYSNNGFRDQIAALRWVQENIRQFGGNPKLVTVFGESAGAHSIDYLLVSSQAKGLFHQIILESGTALSVRSLQRAPMKYINNLANYFNTSGVSAKVLVENLRNADAHDLVRAADDDRITGFDVPYDTYPFGPVMEVPHPAAVVSKSIYESFEKGDFQKLPFMVGYNTGEGSFGIKSLIERGKDVTFFEERPELLTSASMNIEDSDMRAEITNIVKSYFFANSPTSDHTKLSKYFSQELYVRAIRKALDYRRKYTKGYFYRFSYEGTFSGISPGVGHAEELMYLFYLQDFWNVLKPVNYSAFNEKDLLVCKRMAKLWTNFAKTGMPTPEEDSLLENVIWPEVNTTTVAFLDIGEHLVTGENPDEEDFHFWEDIFFTYSQPPLFTY